MTCCRHRKYDCSIFSWRSKEIGQHRRKINKYRSTNGSNWCGCGYRSTRIFPAMTKLSCIPVVGTSSCFSLARTSLFTLGDHVHANNFSSKIVYSKLFPQITRKTYALSSSPKNPYFTFVITLYWYGRADSSEVIKFAWRHAPVYFRVLRFKDTLCSHLYKLVSHVCVSRKHQTDGRHSRSLSLWSGL